MQYIDRYLKCCDCGNEFVFTAGEQLFFHDKQFKNDPKRCKLCKAKRAGHGRATTVDGVTSLPFSRTETRTECSACGIETTVPFKPTQGRPVLCRECFQLKRPPATTMAAAAMHSVEAAMEATIQMEAVHRNGTVPSAAATMEMIGESPMSIVLEGGQEATRP